MSQPAVAPVPPLGLGRLAACLGLVVALVVIGLYQTQLLAFLTSSWNALLTALGLGTLLARMQQNTSQELTKGSIPAMVTGSLVYIGICLLLLHLLLRSRARTRWAVQTYLVVFGLGTLLLLLGKLSGVVLFYKLARRLIDLTVSPLPFMLLLALLWPRRNRMGNESNG